MYKCDIAISPDRVSFRGVGGAFAPLALACPPWEFCSDSESIQVF